VISILGGDIEIGDLAAKAAVTEYPENAIAAPANP
jgi:hypothetical protein